MKRNILLIAALAFTAFGMQSCLDYDDPGSELGGNQVSGPTDDNIGNISKIDYRKEITQEGFKKAKGNLQSYFGQSVQGQYILRGAKEGEVPPKAHAYQQQYCLGPDGYAQYFVVPHKDFMYGTMTSTYNVSDEFNGGALYSYTGVKNSLMPLLHHTDIDSIPEYKAINLLWYCLAAQERADLSGPFTYLEDKQKAENPTVYNDLETIYTGIVEDLDTIVKCLQYFENRPDWYKKELEQICMGNVVTTRDLFSGFSGMTPHIKLANSLKLRMALHVVKVRPDLAQKWAEEAVDPANGGVIEKAEEQQGCYPFISGFNHPLVDICNSWNDIRLSASLESLLMSLKHPYAEYVFEKNNNDVTDAKTEEVTLPQGTQICGVRAGTLVGDGQSYAQNPLQAYSRVNAQSLGQAPLYLIKFAEVDFLRAEGALRGWNMGGTAEFFYNRGIQNAYIDDPMMADYSLYKEKVNDYMNLEQPVPYVNKDWYGGNEDWPSVTKIGVKWNEGDSQETKLEKIITQKYLALFPLSNEAWTELRRTGYPALFPVLNTDDGDGSIPQGGIIRRIPWVPTDPQVQAAVEATGIPALGGEDLQGTRLWWDVDEPNF